MRACNNNNHNFNLYRAFHGPKQIMFNNKKNKQSEGDYRLKVLFNRCVFKEDFKMSRDGVLRMLGGKEFQMVGATEQKADPQRSRGGRGEWRAGQCQQSIVSGMGDRDVGGQIGPPF